MNNIIKVMLSYTFATLSGVCFVSGVTILKRG